MSSTLRAVRVLAFGCGAAVAGVYYAQPLLAAIAVDLGVSAAQAGNLVAAGQIGYATGLLLLVPLGDLFDRRRVVCGQLLLLACALLAVALSPGWSMALPVIAAVGLLAVVTQTMVAQASLLVPPPLRGRAVGTVTAGVVAGIVAARVLGGLLGSQFGWRAVYATAAGAVAVAALAIWWALPAQGRGAATMSYPRLVLSTLGLLAREPLLRSRGLIGMFSFAAMTVLLTPLALATSAPPWRLETWQIGLFGLSGLAGAGGAALAGRRADAGAAQPATLAGLAAMLLAWLVLGQLPQSLGLFAAGLLIFDFALQLVHVSNQSVLYATIEDARSRIAAGYMVFYAIGCAAGAALSTRIFAVGGWSAVCLAGASCSIAALLCWRFGERRPGRR